MVEAVLRLIIRWIEEGREIPARLNAQLGVLRGRVSATNKDLVNAVRTFGEFVTRQELMRNVLRKAGIDIEKSRGALLDFADIADDLARRLAPFTTRVVQTLKGATVNADDLEKSVGRATLSINKLRSGIEAALPTIGTELAKLRQQAEQVPQASQEMMELDVVARAIASHLSGVSVPQVLRALRQLKEKYGLTYRDIINVFEIASIAQKRVSDQMVGNVETLGNEIRRFVPEFDNAFRVRYAQAIARARQGLSPLREETHKIVTEEEFLKKSVDEARDSLRRMAPTEAATALRKIRDYMTSLYGETEATRYIAKLLGEDVGEVCSQTEQVVKSATQEVSKNVAKAEEATDEIAQRLQTYDLRAEISKAVTEELASTLRKYADAGIWSRRGFEAVLDALEAIMPGFKQAAKEFGINEELISKLKNTAVDLAKPMETLRAEAVNVAVGLAKAAYRAVIANKRVSLLGQTTKKVIDVGDRIAAEVPESLTTVGEAARDVVQDYLEWWETVNKAQEQAEVATQTLEAYREAEKEAGDAVEEMVEAGDRAKQLFAEIAEMAKRAAAGEVVHREELEGLIDELEKLAPGFKKKFKLEDEQLEKITFMGRSYDETTEIFRVFSNAVGKGTEKMLDATAQASNMVYQAYKSLDSLAAQAAATGGTLDKTAAKTFEAAAETIGLKRATDYLARRIMYYKKHQEEAGLTLAAFRKKLEVTGLRMGWLAYRTTMIGTITMRYFTAPVKFAMKTALDWDRSIDTVIEALAGLARAGELTSDRQRFLAETIERLIYTGPVFAGAWSYVQSALMNVAVQAVAPLIPLLVKVADVIVELAPTIIGELVPAITIMTREFTSLLPVISAMISAAIPPFVAGLRAAVDALMLLSIVMRPFLPIIASLLGFIAPMSPLLLLIGTGMYFASTAAALFAKLLTVLAWLTKAFVAVLSGKVALEIKDAFWQTVNSAKALLMAKSFAAAKTAAVGLVVGLKALLSALLPILAVISTVAFAFWIWTSTMQMTSAMTTVAMTTMSEAVFQLEDDYTSAFDNLSDVTKAFRVVVQDESRQIYMEIDTLTGKVYDATGRVVGEFDRQTGVVRDLAGVTIGFLSDTSDQYFDIATRTLIPVSDRVVEALEGVSNAVGRIAENFNKATMSAEAFRRQALENLIAMWQMSAAMDEFNRTVNEALYRFSAYSAVTLENSRYTRDFIQRLREAAEAGVFTADQIRWISEQLRAYARDLVLGRLTLSEWLDILSRSTSLTKEQREVLESLRRMLEGMCFVHAASMANVFRSSLDETIKTVEEAVVGIRSLRTQLQEFEGARFGIAIAAAPTTVPTATPQYVTVYSYVTIGEVKSPADYAEVYDVVNRAIADALRRRLP